MVFGRYPYSNILKYFFINLMYLCISWILGPGSWEFDISTGEELDASSKTKSQGHL